MPSDLQLSLGYFAVKMRGPAEKALSVRGFGSEADYFASHATYDRPRAVFMSVWVFRTFRHSSPACCCSTSASTFRASLAGDGLHQATERQLTELGPAVPSDDASRSALVQNVCASFCREFVGALVERADVKTGRKIKDAFTALQAHQAISRLLIRILGRVPPRRRQRLRGQPPLYITHRAARAHDHAPGEAAARKLLPPCLCYLSDVRGCAHSASAFCTKGALALSQSAGEDARAGGGAARPGTPTDAH